MVKKRASGGMTIGPLIKYVGVSGPRSFRIIPLKASVAEACNDDGWLMPPPRSNQALNLHVHLTTIALPNTRITSDTVGWFVSRGFSASKTWSVLRPRDEAKSWADLVWFKHSVPKHAFTLWIANLDRLPNKNKTCFVGLSNPSDLLLVLSVR